MKHFAYQFFIFFCCALFVTGCVFSWKPNIQDSNVNVSDKTDMEVSHEAGK